MQWLLFASPVWLLPWPALQSWNGPHATAVTCEITSAAHAKTHRKCKHFKLGILQKERLLYVWKIRLTHHICGKQSKFPDSKQKGWVKNTEETSLLLGSRQNSEFSFPTDLISYSRKSRSSCHVSFKVGFEYSWVGLCFAEIFLQIVLFCRIITQNGHSPYCYGII